MIQQVGTERDDTTRQASLGSAAFAGTVVTVWLHSDSSRHASRRRMSKSTEEFERQIVGLCFPRDEVVANGRRLRRRWAVRTARALPSEAALDSLSRDLTEKMSSLWKESLKKIVEAKRLATSVPEVSVRKIGTQHCVVTIESQTSRHSATTRQSLLTALSPSWTPDWR